MIINTEEHRKHFENHVATLTKTDDVTILDFKNPESPYYQIRFLFDNKYCKLHISGDLGDLTATNYDNMAYEHFGAFVNSTSYFSQKIDCHTRPIVMYDEQIARKKLIELIETYELQEKITKEFDICEGDYEFALKEMLDYVMEDFSEEQGLGELGYSKLSEYFDEAWEVVGELGMENTGILELYMFAFKLAKEQLTNLVRKVTPKKGE